MKKRKSNSFRAKVKYGTLIYEINVGSKLYEQFNEFVNKYYEENCRNWFRSKGKLSFNYRPPFNYSYDLYPGRPFLEFCKEQDNNPIAIYKGQDISKEELTEAFKEIAEFFNLK